MNKTVPVIIAAIYLMALSAGVAGSQTQQVPALVGPAWTLLHAESAKLNAMQSYSADISCTVYDIHTGLIHQVGFVQCLKPNYLRMEIWTAPPGALEDPAKLHEIYLSDGRTIWHVRPEDGKLAQSPAMPDGSDIHIPSLCDGALDDFFKPNAVEQTFGSPLFGGLLQNSVGEEAWHSLDLQVIRGSVTATTFAHSSSPAAFLFSNVNTPEVVSRIYLNHDGLICGLARKYDSPYEIRITNIRPNAPLSPADFVFHQPAFAFVPKTSPEAVTILERSAKAYAALSAVTATVVTDTRTLSGGKPGPVIASETTAVKLMSPNKGWTFTTYSAAGGFAAKPDDLLVSDGTTIWNYWDPKNRYYEEHTIDPHNQAAIPIGNLSVPFSLSPFADQVQLTLLESDDGEGFIGLDDAGQAAWKGQICHRVRLDLFDTTTDGPLRKESRTLWIGSDSLIHRYVDDIPQPDGSINETDTYVTHIDTHPELADADFAFVPPAGAVLKSPGGRAAPPVTGQMLAPGAVAPDFTLRDRLNAPIHFADYKGKVVVLDFWGVGCGPCIQAMPYLNSVAARFRNKPVAVLGIDALDGSDAFVKWVEMHKDYSSVKFGLGAQNSTGSVLNDYHVTGIPAQFVIGRDGRIIMTRMGYDGNDFAQDPLGTVIKKALAEE